MNQLVSKKIIDIILDHKKNANVLSEVEFLKCQLGVEIFLINLSKMIIIYGVSAVVGLLPQTFLFHLSFMTIRISAFGSHAQSSWACTLISLLFLVGIPSIVSYQQCSTPLLILISCINFLLLYLYAPGKTEKNYLGSMEHQRKLKIRSLIGNCLLLVISLVVKNTEIKNLLIFGALLGGFFVTPVSQKIFSIKLRKKV